LQRTLAYALSFVAGYVDACTFLALFGLFVAQVTGSFVIAGTAPVAPEAGLVIKTLAIPVFVIAAAATTILVSATRRAGRSAWAWALGLEIILLVVFLWIGVSYSPFGAPDQPAALLAGLCAVAAMGVQSASVRLLGQGAPSTNVMTTNTTQLAIDATHLLLARLRTNTANKFVPNFEIGKTRQRFAETARIMVGFFAGVVVGALAYRQFGFIGLAPAILILLGLLVAALLRDLS
jgi:uncharacterized membrane protein YoaK (UPF0700 family)